MVMGAVRDVRERASHGALTVMFVTRSVSMPAFVTLNESSSRKFWKLRKVLETARRYYPAEVSQIEDTFAGMVNSGRLKGPISGEELYSFLRRLGLVFSMDVKIRVKERGELKTLEQKFREGVR